MMKDEELRMIRSEGQLTKHDARVLSMALNYKRMGYSVQADLPGDEFSTPDEINSFRPDIIAYRPIGFQKFKTIIVEVETEETVLEFNW